MVQQRANAGTRKKSGASGMRFKSSKKSPTITAGSALRKENSDSGTREERPSSPFSPSLHTTSVENRKRRQKTRRGITLPLLPEKSGVLQSRTVEEGTLTTTDHQTAKLIAKQFHPLHPAQERRNALKKRREAREKHGSKGPHDSESNPLLSSAKERLDAMKADIHLYEKAVNTPLFQEDPLAVIVQHLDATLEVLQPKTPDVGRAPRPSAPIHE